MNERRESDSLIVSRKPSNKIRDNKRVAEKVERRGLAKGNPSKRNKGWTQSQITLPSELERVRQTKGLTLAVYRFACASLPEAGAQCISSACWDLCGGCRVTGIPTATIGLLMGAIVLTISIT